MKIPSAHRLVRNQGTLAARCFAGAIAALFAAHLAHAGNVTWDSVADGSAITGGDGIWDESTGNWTTDDGATNIPWVNANNDVAVFGGVAGTVTLGTGITVGGLTFNDNDGYLLTGNTLTFGAAGSIITNANAKIASVIASSFTFCSVTKNGPGTLTLAGANLHDGGTFVNAGTLALSGSGTLGAPTAALTVTGATAAVDLGATAQTVGTVSLKAGAQINNGTLTGTSFLVENGASKANLAGSGANLSKTTTGTVTLSGANTFDGLTSISAGTLQATKAASLPNQTTPGFATVANAATLRLNVGGADEFTGADVLNVVTNATFNSATAILGLDTSSADFTLSQLLTKTLGLTKFGPNTLTLTGAGSTIGGTILVNAGTLAINGGASLVAGTPTYVNFGSSLTIGNAGSAGVLSDTQFYIGSAVGSDNNSVIVTGAGSKLIRGTGAGSGTHRLYLGMALNGAQGGNHNTLTISDGGYVYSGGGNSDRSIIGNRSHDNTVTVTDPGSQWYIKGNNLALGAGGSVDATDTLNSLLITNGGLVTMGSQQCAGIGCALNANHNSITVTGAGSTWNMGTGQLNVGGAAGNLAYNAAGNVVSYNNSLTVTNAGVLSNLNHLKVGNFAAANNNTAAVRGGGLLEINTSITMGAAGSTGNTLTIDTGGVLQFKTASPALTISPDNSVTINGATLSYKNVSSAGANLLDGSAGGTGVGMFTWAGTNIFRLDSSTETDGGNYTFANNLGAKNYAGLELFGFTAMARAITLDGSNGGTLRLTGATATITGGITLIGTVSVTASGTASTLTGVITGTGALTKAGPATLTLASVNTFGGNTTVSEGTLKLASANPNNDSASVTLADSATLELAFDESGGEVTDTVSRLVIGTIQMPAGIYGASGSGATITDDTHFAGNGTLTVTSGGGATPYDTWAAAKGLTELNKRAELDPDGDGRNNLAEFAFSGNPLNSADNGQVHVLQADSDADAPDTAKELILTLAVRKSTAAFTAGAPATATSGADGISYAIEGSLDLFGFGVTVMPVGLVPPGVALSDPANYEYRSFSLSGSNGLPGRGYLRAKVTQP